VANPAYAYYHVLDGRPNHRHPGPRGPGPAPSGSASALVNLFFRRDIPLRFRFKIPWTVTLTWVSAQGETGYNIYRNGTLITKLGQTAISYTDNAPRMVGSEIPGRTY